MSDDLSVFLFPLITDIMIYTCTISQFLYIFLFFLLNLLFIPRVITCYSSRFFFQSEVKSYINPLNDIKIYTLRISLLEPRGTESP